MDEWKLLRGMTMLRTLSACVEVVAAILFWRMSRLEHAVRLNAILGAVGPLIFTGVSLLGLWGLAGKMPVGKLAVVGLGILMIIWGTR